MIVSPTWTSATCPLRTNPLNSLYVICFPAGARKYAWPIASNVRTPSTHHRAVGLWDCWRRSLPPGGSDGLGMYRVSFREAQLATGEIHHDGVALAERAFEHAERQGIQQLPLQ